jgi:hypothetical protein
MGEAFKENLDEEIMDFDVPYDSDEFEYDALNARPPEDAVDGGARFQFGVDPNGGV